MTTTVGRYDKDEFPPRKIPSVENIDLQMVGHETCVVRVDWSTQYPIWLRHGIELTLVTFQLAKWITKNYPGRITHSARPLWLNKNLLEAPKGSKAGLNL